MPDACFAVIDIEITGYHRRASDRIIEIAILHLDDDGQEIRRYSTVINPEMDVGSSWFHGIRARDVLNAPTFDEVAGDVLEHLRGVIVVGHHLEPGLRFLRDEYKRIGVDFPKLPILDTFRLAERVVNSAFPARQLKALCRFWRIPLENPNHAEEDAVATIEVFRSCSERLGRPLHDLLSQAEERAPLESWPDLPASGRSYPRHLAKVRPREATYLSKILDRLPVQSTEEPDLDTYLCTLDEILEDRRIFDEDVEELAELAQELELSAELIKRAHREYVLNLLIIAFEDHHISAIEEEDLLEVCQLLGVTDQEYRELREKVKNGEGLDVERDWLGYGPEDVEGKTVCFTGELRGRIDGDWRIDGERAAVFAEDQGMIVHRQLSKDTDFLIVADPYTLSSELSRAREYGVRVFAEPVFWRMVGLEDVR